MKISKLLLILLTLGFLSTYSCKSKKIPLTPEELSIEVRAGDQETSLALYKMYIPLSTETISNEDQARSRAVELGADVIQFIYSGYSNRGITYRFWKRKD